MPAPAASTAALTAVGLVGGGLVTAVSMGLFGKNHMPVDGKTVLLTGASDGMGRSVAKQLAAQGASVIVVARNVGRLEETVAELKSSAKSDSQRFRYIVADVAQPDYARPVLAEAVAWNGGRPLDVVWCVAGTSTPMLFAEEERDVAVGATRHNMDVNFWGTAEMAHAVLREWLRPAAAASFSEPRHLVLTSSVVAFFSVAGYAAYAPSKWALRGLADALAQEALLYEATNPVRVAVVYPGTILSAGFERENTTKPAITVLLEKDDPQLTPDQVASASIRGLQRGDLLVTTSFLGRLMRCGVLGGSPRNNWLLDTFLAYLVAFVMLFVVFFQRRDIRGFAKEHGHPSTYKKA